MIHETFTGLINNLALLLVLVLLYNTFSLKRIIENQALEKALSGILLGVLGIVLIMNPWEIREGVLFDARTMFIGLSALFFGTIPSIVLVAMTSFYRFSIGGTGTWMGISVIITSAGIGLIWRRLTHKSPDDYTFGELFLLGLVLHTVPTVFLVLLPRDAALQILSHVSLMIIVIYPLGTAVLGKLLATQYKQRKMEEALLRNEAILNETQRLAKIGGWEHPADTNRLFWTDEMYRIHGVSKEDFDPNDAEHIQRLFHPDDLETIITAHRAAVYDGKPYDLVLRLKPSDGHTSWIRTIAKVETESGKVVRAFGHAMDITKEKETQAAQKKLEEQFRQAQKMEAVGTLAGGIAHDFNNILSAIFGYTELALGSMNDREALEKYLPQILSAGKRARDLVDHILTFSRKTADQDREPIIPRYIIKEAVKLLRASLPSTIGIRSSLNSSAAVLGSPTQIHQIIMNLCTNAGYEMKERGGGLDLCLDEFHLEKEMPLQHPGMPPGKYLRLKISDSGPGIPPDVLDRIFDPFFTTKPTGEGTGLGLSVVHGIVKSMKGEISVASKTGEGSAFTILLPVVDAKALSIDDTERKQLPEGTERVLLVDDEEAIIDSMRVLMEGLGYSVRAFTRSTSAWEEFSGAPDAFDIIITDYTMPGITGISLARKIRELRPDVPIILCSGYLELEKKVSELQPISFVKKPITAHELAHALRRMLDHSPEIQ